MRLDGVEIKVSLVAEQTTAALELLDLPEMTTWAIHFLEDVTPGLTALTPLLDEHLIIRVRQKAKGYDVAVKLRPGRRSQLATSWLQTTASTHAEVTEELKVEEDWAADRRSLAISLTAKRKGGGATVMESTATDLLTENQKRFIKESGATVNLDVLTILPPITAMRWPTFTVPDPDGGQLSVRAERWTVPSLDFLELSVVSKVHEAERAQDILHTYVTSLGLQLDTVGAKTNQVLQLLVAQAAGLPDGRRSK